MTYLTERLNILITHDIGLPTVAGRCDKRRWDEESAMTKDARSKACRTEAARMKVLHGVINNNIHSTFQIKRRLSRQ